MRDMSIIICGVGGQGVLFLTRLLGETAIRMRKKAISAEMRGMSQMLGSVSSLLRIGNYSSADFSQADLVLSLEPLEALRYSYMLSDDGLIITSDNRVMMKGYPENVFEKLKARKSMIVNTKGLSGKIDKKARDNVVLFGVFCKKFEVPKNVAERVLDGFKEREKNISAFRAGFGYEI